LPDPCKSPITEFNRNKQKVPESYEAEMARRLTRKQLAEFLTAEGFPISVAWLNRMAMQSIGGGPPAVGMWGKRPLYDPAAALAWAEARFRPIDPNAPSPPPKQPGRRGRKASTEGQTPVVTSPPAE
jgi:hypothetical protein